jgi:hypothetical protein
MLNVPVDLERGETPLLDLVSFQIFQSISLHDLLLLLVMGLGLRFHDFFS